MHSYYAHLYGLIIMVLIWGSNNDNGPYNAIAQMIWPVIFFYTVQGYIYPWQYYYHHGGTKVTVQPWIKPHSNSKYQCYKSIHDVCSICLYTSCDETTGNWKWRRWQYVESAISWNNWPLEMTFSMSNILYTQTLSTYKNKIQFLLQVDDWPCAFEIQFKYFNVLLFFTVT